MEKTGDGNTDGRQNLNGFVINRNSFLDVVGAERKDMVQEQLEPVADSFLPFSCSGLFDEILSINKPDFTEHDDAVGGKDDTESGNCRGEMRGKEDLNASERLLKVHEQGHHCHRQ